MYFVQCTPNVGISIFLCGIAACMCIGRESNYLMKAGFKKNILYSETQISCTLQRWSSHTLKHISPRDESVGVEVHRGIFL